ncbi:MAG: polysaccharide biosynthesis/export family protein, partial [Stellaceae bacterium]
MRRGAFHALLTAMLVLAGCSVPSTGPLRTALIDQAGHPAHPRFDVVTIDNRVVDTLLAQPRLPFRSRFKKYSPPPELPIAVGDMLGITVWESSATGLFGRSLNANVLSGDELTRRLLQAGITLPSGPLSASQQEKALARLNTTAQGQALLQSMHPTGRVGARVPDQQVGADGAISVPYAGRIHVVGQTPTQVQQLIQEMLAGKALDPQTLVLVKSSFANSVTVTGDLVAGARVTL